MTFQADWSQAQTDIGDEIATRELPQLDYVLITGNPIFGFRFRGPFIDRDEATKWADEHDFEADWWAFPLDPPTDEVPT